MTRDEKLELARSHDVCANNRRANASREELKARSHERWAGYFRYAAEHDCDVEEARRRIMEVPHGDQRDHAAR